RRCFTATRAGGARSPPARSRPCARSLARAAASTSAAWAGPCSSASLRLGAIRLLHRARAVALGVAGEIGEGADELPEVVAELAGEVDELDAHARVQVLLVAGAVRVDPDDDALALEDAEAGRAKAEVQPRAGQLGRDGADEDA